MLTSLKVSDIALIEDATVDLEAGLCVLSGETGAGKTAMLSALKLLVGERGDSQTVRDGAASGEVEGTFCFGEPPATHVASRRLSADGRSRCAIDGGKVPVSDLAQTIGPLVDLHGQHEHQTLLSPSSHLHFFDRWIGDEAAGALQAYREAYAARGRAARECAAIETAAHASRQDIEVARFVISEIESAKTQEGEYEELSQSLPAMQHAESLAEAADRAHELLYGDGQAGDLLSQASAALAREAGIDRHLDELSTRISDCVAEVGDIAGELRDYRDSLDFDPADLERRLDRLGVLDGLCRKYGPRMCDVFERLDSARRTVELQDTSAERLAAAQQALADAEENLDRRAHELQAVREAAADPFSEAVSGSLSSLGMGTARIMLAMSDLPRSAWTEDGSQHIELLYCPASSVSARPLARIASGGELSRVMLGLLSILTSPDPDVTLVFDEIDAGIGGATARLVGQRLKALSAGHQVIVVTHLAQIAALADAHYVVRKGDDPAFPKTTITRVEGDERVFEIARMLSGDVGEASLQHARALLDGRE